MVSKSHHYVDGKLRSLFLEIMLRSKQRATEQRSRVFLCAIASIFQKEIPEKSRNYDLALLKNLQKNEIIDSIIKPIILKCSISKWKIYEFNKKNYKRDAKNRTNHE